MMEQANQDTVATLREICNSWDNAIATNSVSAIGKFMASDWVIIGTEGGITAKSGFLKFIESGDLVHTSMAFEDIRIAVYGESAIVTSKGTSSGNYKGTPFSYFEWSTNVFVLSQNEWLCVLTMLTPAERGS
jgi:ketosteroid isomerase-like protein